jgi:baculoviral IAP repeat-containing protein 6
MILCETPFANNPGIESLGRYQDENEAYNRGIRAATVRVAMIPWLQSPPEIWKDVVGLHFKKNAEKILQKVGQWEEMELRARLRNPGMRLTMGTTIGMPEDMSGVRQQLHGALQRFGAISRSHTLSQVNRPEQIHGSSRTSHAHGYGGYGSRGPGGQSRRW